MTAMTTTAPSAIRRAGRLLLLAACLVVALPDAAWAEHRVPTDYLADLVTDALADETPAGEGLEIRFNRRALTLGLPDAVSLADLAIGAVRYDARTGRFTVEFVWPMEAEKTGRHAASGQAMRTRRVPVLSRRIAAGETVDKGDLSWITMPVHRIGATMLTRSAEITGKAARRPLPPGRPVQDSDLRQPYLVDKGSLVTMIVRSGALTLTATGRAMGNASHGQAVRVVNLDSRRTVEGVVVGPGEVQILSAGRITTAAAR